MIYCLQIEIIINFNMSDSEDEWTPPSEAEMKVIQAKRERSDKISKVMGDYLLKGYKMLATSCPLCLTIELQDKQGATFCVACQEVDCHETSKDDPALSQQAASRIIQEEAFSSSNTRDSPAPSSQRIIQEEVFSSSNTRTSQGPATAPSPSSSSYRAPAQSQSSSNTRTVSVPSHVMPVSPPSELGARPRLTSSTLPEAERSLLSHTRSCLHDKLAWTNSELKGCLSPERATQLVILAREIIQTLVTLQQHSQSH